MTHDHDKQVRLNKTAQQATKRFTFSQLWKKQDYAYHSWIVNWIKQVGKTTE